MDAEALRLRDGRGELETDASERVGDRRRDRGSGLRLRRRSLYVSRRSGDLDRGRRGGDRGLEVDLFRL